MGAETAYILPGNFLLCEMVHKQVTWRSLHNLQFWELQCCVLAFIFKKTSTVSGTDKIIFQIQAVPGCCQSF